MNNVIFFDGVCNLCNGLINFLIDRDKKNLLKFSSLQSNFAQSKLKDFNIDPLDMQSVIYLKDENLYFKSSAVLEIFKDLGGFFYLLYIFKYILPRFIRDAMYNFIANNRYKWFGKSASCRLPNNELMSKFME